MNRGQRNNNPLNIRRGNDRWQGERREQTDKCFVQFENMAYGYRAAWKVLETYWKRFREKRELFTVKNIINRWAPPNENDTEAYIRTVLKLTGLGGNENLPRPFKGIAVDKLDRLLAAMTCVECGIPWREVDMESIVRGFELAFPGKKRQKLNRPFTASPQETVSLPPEVGPEKNKCHWDEYWDWSPKAYE